MMQKPKPCPFCGAEPYLHNDVTFMFDHQMDKCFFAQTYGRIRISGDSEIELWNTRAIQDVCRTEYTNEYLKELARERFYVRCSMEFLPQIPSKSEIDRELEMINLEKSLYEVNKKIEAYIKGE